MVKTVSGPVDIPRFQGSEDTPKSGGLPQNTVPAHKNFRVKVWFDSLRSSAPPIHD